MFDAPIENWNESMFDDLERERDELQARVEELEKEVVILSDVLSVYNDLEVILPQHDIEVRDPSSTEAYMDGIREMSKRITELEKEIDCFEYERVAHQVSVEELNKIDAMLETHDIPYPMPFESGDDTTRVWRIRKLAQNNQDSIGQETK